MLNKRPIFIVGFQRGGSNILLNLLRSHTQVCDAGGEAQELFIGKPNEAWQKRLPKILDYLPILLTEKQHIFHLSNWQARKPFHKSSQKRIDHIIYKQKLKAKDPSQNLYKSQDILYSDEEIASARVLTKTLSGLIYLGENLATMYPDATFIALIRNGLAVCEGASRRGTELSEMARYYQQGCQQMLSYSKHLPNYHIFRYEDLMAKPLETLSQILKAADLDIGHMNSIRQEIKPLINKEGKHLTPTDKAFNQLVWYDLNNFMNHLVPNVNDNQIQRLSQEQKASIINECGSSLEQFGYL
jgi:hypothetical protein